MTTADIRTATKATIAGTPTTEEPLTKALHDAEFLSSDLRDAYAKTEDDEPLCIVLEDLTQTVAGVRQRLERIAR